MTGNEQHLRRRLGIPGDAARVLILGESSHWDPNWLHTSGEYFERWVGPNLDLALAELQREPRRIYSVECLFFLRLYWEARPHLQETIRALVNEGRLRLTSSGVTTPDTIVPRAEAILRDWLVGQEWLRRHGMAWEPRLAYFTDSFGSSPALPSLLAAAGFDRAAITRIDGMYFGFADYERARNFPRPGSSAELLAKELRTVDFVWRGPDGAEVLCHWNAFGYGQGDMIAHWGLGRMYLVPLAIPSRSGPAVAGRIERIAAQLAPLSRTPYLFCPIGFDFVPPIPDLVALVDRYNRAYYPASGLWVVNAGLDDYLALVDEHRQALPTLELDPNPYWTGFYTSRPTLKKRAHELVESLLQAERLALLPGNEGAAATVNEELAEAWWAAVTANHHDFITGTSPDRIAEGEQEPMLVQAAKVAGDVALRLAPLVKAQPQPGARAQALPQWRRQGGKVEVHTPHYTVVLAEEAGGAIVGAWDAAGAPLLAGASNDLVCYDDSGGLWRMGHEFGGGYLHELARASARPAALEIAEREGGLEVSCSTVLGEEVIRRRAWFSCASPLIHLRVEGRAAPRRTVTVRFDTGLSVSRLAMDVPGGVAIRPPVKLYTPTFWPLQSFLHTYGELGGRGLALLVGLPGAVSCRPDGRIELIALRNATRELAWGLLPLPATPATGHERTSYAAEYALLFTAAGGWQENNLPQAVATAVSPWQAGPEAALSRLAAPRVTTDRTDVSVTTVKPASRGEGLIVRLSTCSAAGKELEVSLPGHHLRAAALCDARERDLCALEVQGGAALLTMPGNIATVRLIV